MQYDKMKFAVGVFVLTLIIAISTILYFLLEEKGTFDKRYSYHFDTDSASSFNIGMPLKFSGFNIGVIDDISLEDDGTVHMTFSVSQHNKKWISKGSVLMIKKPLIGSPHIEVYSALGNPILKEGSTLTMLMSDDINDMISKLEPAVERITSIINSIDKITTYIASPDSDLMQSLQNINQFSKKLASDNSLLTTITGDAKSTQSIIDTMNQTTKIMQDIKLITADISKITASLDTKIIDPTSLSIEEVKSIMEDVKQKLEYIDGTVKSIGSYDSELIELKEQLSVGLQKSNQIMDKVDAIMQDEKATEVVLP